MKAQLRFFDYMKIILYPPVIIAKIFQKPHGLFGTVDVDDI